MDSDRDVFIGAMTNAGSSFLTYVMSTVVDRGSLSGGILEVKDVIRVAEMPTPAPGGQITVQLAIMTDLYFSTPSTSKVRVDEFFMWRFADRETDGRLLQQYNNELVSLSAKRSGIVPPSQSSGLKRV